MENEAAKLLKSAREKQFPDVKKFSKVVGYSELTIRDYETGTRFISDRAVAKFAAALNLEFRVEKQRFLCGQPV